jgi:peptidyl-prolyl cis-trans isomerase D
MSVLASIRNRAGLLVTVIGVAMLIFILQAALESGRWFANDRNVGEIAGKSVPVDAFDLRVKQGIENYKRQSQQTTIDPGTEDMVVQQTWNQLINEMVYSKEYEKLGLNVSEDELYDLMLVHPHKYVIQQFTDRETGRINKEFIDPQTGMLDTKKLKALVEQMNEQQEASWSELENAVKQYRISEKYNNLIKSGLYVTTLEAKYDYIAQNKQFTVRFVEKKYNSVPDSSVKITESDLTSYYNEHQNDYRQDQETRKAEYISYDVVPTSEDIEAIKSEMSHITEEFKTRNRTEDSAYVIAEADSHNFDLALHKKGSLSPEIDSLMFSGSEGLVYGPYIENNAYKVAKLIDVKMLADSVKARHALIAFKGAMRAAPSITRTKTQAKAMADSLFKLINEKKIKFEDVNQVSDDAVSKSKTGDMGWFNESAQLAPPFKDGALSAKKGAFILVESDFGFHIIEVTDRSKGESKYVRVAIIDRKIEPSNKTIQSYYSKAGEFAGKSKTAEAFQKAVADQKLSKRLADDVKEGDKSIPGLENPKELIRWMYNEKTSKGSVSDVFEMGNKFIVALLTEIRPKGIPSLDIVRGLVEPKAKEKKKMELFSEEFTKNLSGNNLEVLAQKMALHVENMDNLTFNTYSIPGSGHEDIFVGTAVSMKAGAVSKPVGGRSGVFVIAVDKVKEPPAPTGRDFKNIMAQSTTALQARVEYEVFDALKDNANIVDKKAKFY